MSKRELNPVPDVSPRACWDLSSSSFLSARFLFPARLLVITLYHVVEFVYDAAALIAGIHRGGFSNPLLSLQKKQSLRQCSHFTEGVCKYSCVFDCLC